MEGEIEEVYEVELEEGVEPNLGIESEAGRTLRSRSVPHIAFLQFAFIAAPKFSAAHRESHGDRISSGPA
jgi:hypothetical protein